MCKYVWVWCVYGFERNCCNYYNCCSMVHGVLCNRHFSLLKLVIFIGHIDGPTEFITLSFIVDLFNWNIMLFAPVDGRPERETRNLVKIESETKITKEKEAAVV